MMLLNVFLVLFFFSFTVFVHELGHYLAARWLGLIVKAFSIGFGPALMKFEKGGTKYKFSLIPFGGYVSLPQLDPETMSRVQGKEGDSAADEEYIPPVENWKKIIVAVSGPLGNVVLAILIALVIAASPVDHLLDRDRPVIAAVSTNAAAYAEGLRPGDTILSIDGKKVTSWHELATEALLAYDPASSVVTMDVLDVSGFTNTLHLAIDDPKKGMLLPGVRPAVPSVLGGVTAGGPADRAGFQADDKVVRINQTVVTDWDHFTQVLQDVGTNRAMVTVLRGNETVPLEVVPEYHEGYEKYMIGVSLGGQQFIWLRYKHPVKQLMHDASMITRLLKALMTPKEAGNAASGLGGPLMIFVLIWQSLKVGLLPAIGFIRFINVNLAILNLIPLPVLDGGHVMFALWEMVTRRKIHPKFLNAVITVFAFLLIGAMVLISVRDVQRFVSFRKMFSSDSPAAVETNRVESTGGE